uniref:Uncharacterized protein n=1 Tax=Cacopsylla melanoneura TaxID=428564 RepID=A0A8D9AQ02_9HEMI
MKMNDEEEEENDEQETEIEILKWDEDKKLKYREEMNNEFLALYENNEEELTVNELYEKLKNIIFSVGKKIQMMKLVKKKKIQRRNNWFNKECAIKKRKLRKSTRTCQAKKYEETAIRQLAQDRQSYKEEIRKAKQELNLKIKEKIRNTKNRIQLWETINRPLKKCRAKTTK